MSNRPSQSCYWNRLIQAVSPVAALFAISLLPCTLQAAAAPGEGAVFVASNNSNGNAVMMYRRANNGRIRRVGRFATGGRGQGGINDPMQSQGSLALTPDHAFLLAVNGGTSDISVFQVLDNGLALLGVTPSGGGNPISLTLHDDLVYVLNFAGSSIHTAGFRMRPNGDLSPVRNSRQTLSTLDTAPSTIAFSPDGAKLVISERQTDKIDVFTVNSDGSLSKATVNNSTGKEPFGLTFTSSGALLVTNAAGSVSSYRLEADNTLTLVSGESPASGAATCWIATDDRHAWVSNSVTSNIGGYTIDAGGALTPLGVVATESVSEPTIFPPVNPPTAYPLDLMLSSDGRYLYILYSARGSVIAYKLGDNGALTRIDEAPAFSPQSGVQGLVAF